MSVPIRLASKSARNDFSDIANEGLWPGIDSRFRLIIVAGLRTKQLLHGSHPRIEVDPLRRRNTSIALEEVKRGLVPFTVTALELNGGDINRPLSGKSQA